MVERQLPKLYLALPPAPIAVAPPVPHPRTPTAIPQCSIFLSPVSQLITLQYAVAAETPARSVETYLIIIVATIATPVGVQALRGIESQKRAKKFGPPKKPTEMAVSAGVEPTTFGLGNRCSIR